MWAVVSEQGRWVLRERPAPVPADHEVLVRVLAAGLNRADLLSRAGDYEPSGAGWTVDDDRVGFEAAGLVEAVGAGVDRARVGDRVAAQTGGAFAELVAVDARQLLPVPDERSWVEAAVLPSAVLTAFDALTGPGGFRPGDSVLVTGASSGVGLVTTQAARILGAARVVATSRDPVRAAVLRDAGADEVLVTGHAPLRPVGPVDVVIDLVGGELLGEVLGLVARGGRIAQVGRLGGRLGTLDLEVLARERVSVTGTTFRGRHIDELRGLVSALLATEVWQCVRAPIAAVHSFAEAEKAAADLAGNHHAGKVALTVGRG